MTGASFFRSGEGKCPNCGTFAESMDSDAYEFDDGKECPKCETVFNRFLIFEPGDDVALENN